MGMASTHPGKKFDRFCELLHVNDVVLCEGQSYLVKQGSAVEDSVNRRNPVMYAEGNFLGQTMLASCVKEA